MAKETEEPTNESIRNIGYVYGVRGQPMDACPWVARWPKWSKEWRLFRVHWALGREIRNAVARKKW